MADELRAEMISVVSETGGHPGSSPGVAAFNTPVVTQQVLHHMANAGMLDGGVMPRTMTLPDRLIDQAIPAPMCADAGLSAADIQATMLQTLGVAVIGRRV